MDDVMPRGDLQAKPPVPLVGKKSLDDVRVWFAESVKWEQSWRPRAEENDRIFHGRQWERKDVDDLEQQGREAMTFNHVRKVVEAMVGFRAMNKFEVKYFPRGASDQGTADVRSQLFKFVWDANMAEFEMGDACLDQYKGPVGWLYVGVQQDDPEKEQVKICAVPWKEVRRDPKGRQADLLDHRYQFRERWMAAEAAMALYPEHADAIARFVERRRDERDGRAPMGYPDDDYRHKDDTRYYHAEADEVRVVHGEYRTKRWGHFITMPDGRVLPFDGKSFEHQMAYMTGAKTAPGVITEVFYITWVGDVELEHEKRECRHPYFSLVPVWGWVDHDNIGYGVVEVLRDPQKLINWSYSKLMWIAASRQAIVAEGTVDLNELRVNAARPNGIIKYNPENGPPPRFETFQDTAALNGELLKSAEDALIQIGGSPEEARGQQGDAKSGRAILARQEASFRQAGRYLDNEQRAMVMVGRIVSSLVEQYYTDEKILRVTEADGTTRNVAINVQDPLRRQELQAMGIETHGSILQGDYDVVVATAPLHVTHRHAVLDDWNQMVQTLPPDLAAAIADLNVQNFEIPQKEEIAERLKAVLNLKFGGALGGQPPPAAPGIPPGGPGVPALPPGMAPPPPIGAPAVPQIPPEGALVDPGQSPLMPPDALMAG